MHNLKIISAGAGSGKTYTLTQEMATLLTPKDGQPAPVRASGIIATTFTNKAAAELKERVRVKLLEEGLTAEADELGNAMIGTVHAIGVQLGVPGSIRGQVVLHLMRRDNAPRLREDQPLCA